MSLDLTRDALLGDDPGRYDRQGLIDWWDQSRLARARVLVVGAGALGNEILKNLALLGVGRVLIHDMDRIELSNLSRCVLFSDADTGRWKAEAAAERAGELNPEVQYLGRTEHVVHETGLGVFEWADLVICGVDNREARLFVNTACAATGRVWIDGAIEGLSGIVRLFDPAEGACYECTMNEVDRRIVAERRSCAMLARDVIAAGHVPTTVVAASIIGALQVQEAIKHLHGQPTLSGRGWHLDGRWNELSNVAYQRRADCAGHDHLGPVRALGAGVADLSFGEILERSESELGGEAVLDLSRDFVSGLSCPDCETTTPERGALGRLREREAACPGCGMHRIVQTISSITEDDSSLLQLSPADLGVPAFDLLSARRGVEERITWLFDGDAVSVLGALADDWTLGGTA